LIEHDLFGKPLRTFPDHALKLPSAAGRLQLPGPIGIDVSRGEQIYLPAPLGAAIHAADHFL
jgi:hypothetical protein